MKLWFGIVTLVSCAGLVRADDPPKVEDATAPVIKAGNDLTQAQAAASKANVNTVEGAKAREALKEAGEAYYAATGSLMGTKPGVNGTILVASGKYLFGDTGGGPNGPVYQHRILINNNLIVVYFDPKKEELVGAKAGDDVSVQGCLNGVTQGNGKQPWLFMLQKPKMK